MHDAARIQALAALLFLGFAWLCLDLSSVPVSAWSLLHAKEPAETETTEPTLMGHDEPPTVPARPRETAGGSAGTDEEAAARAAAEERAQRAALPTLVSDDRPRLRSLREAARRLRLSASQVDALMRMLEEVARDLDDLRHVPNEAGETWHGLAADVRRTHVRPARAAQRLAQFSRSVLRGRGERFAEVRRRLLDRYAEGMRAYLTVEQQVVWDAHETSVLLDPQGTLPVRRPVDEIVLRMPTARLAS